MNWPLPTANTHYLIGFTELGGPYLRAWAPNPTWPDPATDPALRIWVPGDPAPPVDRDVPQPSVRFDPAAPDHAAEHGAEAAASAFRTGPDRVSAELSTLGGRQVRSADLIIERDGRIGVRLAWSADDVTVEAEGQRTRLTAVGVGPGLRVQVVIETSFDHDVVSKRAVIENTGDRPVRLTRAFGPAWELPIGPGADVAVLAGDWSREFQPFTVGLPVGELSIGSRQGITSHRYSPVLGLSADGRGVFGVALAWSGSWRLGVEAEPFAERVRVAGGIDDESTVIAIDPGESFSTPVTLGVRAEDHETLAQRWHAFQRRVLCRDLTPERRPVVYNSWYATTFDVRVEHQTALAEVAAGLGVEVFVIDDGWFRGRDSDTRGLGDWTPDPVKFPDGLRPLAEAVQRLGMRFGVWVEPEAVNPDSDLFRAHPDWIHRARDREPLTVRNQYVLDFGNPEVLAWTRDWLRTLLTGAPISYLKWDMNRPISDGGGAGGGSPDWTVRHTGGYYAILRMLRDEFPQVTVEACSGGGGRIDNAVLGLSDVVWTSDETGPRDRLAIQHGFLSAYPASVMSSWVTDEPDRVDHDPASFEFRFLVAMAGVLGVGADLLTWDGDQRERATELIARYRELRSVVHTGRVWRHGTPTDPVYAVEYGTEDRVVIMVWARPGRPERVVITPRSPGRGPVEVPFSLAPDCDMLVLDR